VPGGGGEGREGTSRVRLAERPGVRPCGGPVQARGAATGSWPAVSASATVCQGRSGSGARDPPSQALSGMAACTSPAGAGAGPGTRPAGVRVSSTVRLNQPCPGQSRYGGPRPGPAGLRVSAAWPGGLRVRLRPAGGRVSGPTPAPGPASRPSCHGKAGGRQVKVTDSDNKPRCQSSWTHLERQRCPPATQSRLGKKILVCGSGPLAPLGPARSKTWQTQYASN
jgi:hypothetical protein